MASIIKVHGVEKLSPDELKALVVCAEELGLDPDWLACVICFETGGSFSPSQRNRWAVENAALRGVPYAGAIGLIQFMPQTARALGTTTEALGAMSFVEQLPYVKRYLATYAGRVKSLEDCYLAVFYPAAIGREDGFVMGVRGAEGFAGRVYEQNAGFDKRGNEDGMVTRGEVCATIRAVRIAAGDERIFETAVPVDFPKASPLLDMTELAREADDAARKD